MKRKIKTTANHLNSVYGKEYVQTRDLTTDDYLPYSLRCYGDNDIQTNKEFCWMIIIDQMLKERENEQTDI